MQPFPWDRLTTLGKDEVRVTNDVVALLGDRGGAWNRALGDAAASIGLAETSARLVTIRYAPLGGKAPRDGWLTTFQHADRRLGVLHLDLNCLRIVFDTLLEDASPPCIVDEWDAGFMTSVVTTLHHALARQGAPALSFADEPVDSGRATLLLKDTPHVELVFSVTAAYQSGVVRLFVPRTLWDEFEPGPPRPAPQACRAVPIQFTLVAGDVTLSREEVERLRSGDVVLLQNSAVDASGENLPYAARLRGPDCRVAASCHIVENRWQFTVLEPEPERGIMDETTQLTGAGTIDVELVVGRTTLSFGELTALAPGHVLQADRNVGDAVELVANGVVVARGELVSIEGKVGVRIHRLGAAPPR